LTNGQTGADRWQTPADTRLWSAYNLKTVSSGEWVRLAVQMKYNFNRGVSMFRVLLNNKELTNEFGYSSYTVSTATQPGPWTRCANDILSLNAIALSGAGALDDLLISTNQPSGQSKPTITVTVAGPGTVSPSEVVIMPSDGASTNFSITANSPWSYIKTLQTNGTSLADVEAAKTNSHELSWPDVMGDNTLKVVFDVRTVTSGVPVPIPYQWLDEQGLGSANVTDDALWTSNALSDYDNDGALTWEEYVAGTQPTNDASVLKVLSQTIDTNRVLQVMWLGSPGTLGNIDYELQASTNLSDWSTTQQRTSPAPGTNTWPVGTLDQTRSFYRIRLTTP
jgi:hypothetical protein